MEKQRPVKPRIIIHGGAGNILPENLSQESYHAFREALLDILDQAHQKLSHPGATALDVATFAASLLENNVLFNSGHGAVFTTTGEHELEASVMVSSGYRKRGVGVMGVKGVKNPILLAREMLIRGENEDTTFSDAGKGVWTFVQEAEVDAIICDPAFEADPAKKM